MTSMITPSDLKTSVYKVGGYFEADGKPSPYGGAPGIRTSNMPTASGATAKTTDENKHFVQGFNPLLLSLQVEGDGISKRLNFRPPATGDTNKIIYLPYYQKNITSTVIRTNDPTVCYFITDSFSGCNFFIDALPSHPNFDLVCHHANALQHSPTEAEVKADAGAFNPLAVTTMNEQHRIALEAYPDAVPEAELRVKDNYAKAQAAVQQKLDTGCTDVEFYGGTTVMGFRVPDGTWEFWFQTYAQFSYTYKGKEVRVGAEPSEIIDVQRFWP